MHENKKNIARVFGNLCIIFRRQSNRSSYDELFDYLMGLLYCLYR